MELSTFKYKQAPHFLDGGIIFDKALPSLQAIHESSATSSYPAGVGRSFYSRFASFVAQETGWPVLTYNYRGNEGVLPEAKRKELPQHPLVEVNADMSDWALLDQPAALSYLLAYLRNSAVEEETAVSGGPACLACFLFFLERSA